MRLPKAIDRATRLTREGKLTEALAVLTGATPVAEATAPWPTGRLPEAGAALRTTLDTALGRLGTVLPGLDRRPATRTPPAPAPGEGGFTEHVFAGPAGTLAYKFYRPHRRPEPLPLVVMLHGCTQSPDDFAAGTRMNSLAERDGFAVAYPAQSRAANGQKCWNWFRAIDQGRSGEPALVVGMIEEIARHCAVDPARIYVAGLSAGGAAAAVLGQSYPEVFAAVGVHSGLACGAAGDMASAFAAMRGGAPGPRAGTPMPTVVLHGDRDVTVAPVNGLQVLAQAEPETALTTAVETGRSPGGVAYTRTVQTDRTGVPQAEHWLLHGAGHAWAGGDPAGSFTDPRGPDASEALLNFFRHHSRIPHS